MDLLVEAQIDGIKAQGNAQLRAIASANGDKKEKYLAIANTIINTQKSIIKVLSNEAT